VLVLAGAPARVTAQHVIEEPRPRTRGALELVGALRRDLAPTLAGGAGI
jgi:hypothetical protein